MDRLIDFISTVAFPSLCIIFVIIQCGNTCTNPGQRASRNIITTAEMLRVGSESYFR